jgi:hypothetical protein
MHPLVRDLYKRFLWVGKDYPKGLGYVREKAKLAIVGNKNITNEEELMKAIQRGRFWVNELIGVVKLRKYRTLRRRYGDTSAMPDITQMEEAAMNDAQSASGPTFPSADGSSPRASTEMK